jgi:hypothetical protein
MNDKFMIEEDYKPSYKELLGGDIKEILTMRATTDITESGVYCVAEVRGGYYIRASDRTDVKVSGFVAYGSCSILYHADRYPTAHIADFSTLAGGIQSNYTGERSPVGLAKNVISLDAAKRKSSTLKDLFTAFYGSDKYETFFIYHESELIPVIWVDDLDLTCNKYYR